MAHEIKMPQLSDTMDSGKILVWHKQEGDTIDRGDILAEVETDKANLEIESFHKGTLLKIVASVDTDATVGEVIAYIGEAGEKVPESGSEASKKESEKSEQKDISPGKKDSTPEKKESAAEENISADSESENDSDGRIKASPLARKIASQHGVQLASLQGSGPGGRIVKKDVQSAIVGGGESSTKAMGTSSPHTPESQLPAISQSIPTVTTPPPSGDGTYTPLTKMRATIAKRMQQTVTQSPHFYVRTSIQMDQLLQLRKQLKETSGFEKVSINHMIIKACGYALTKEPRVNNAMRNDMLFTPHGVHIGIVTAVEGGLMIPVIKNVPNLAVKDLAFEARAAIDRARAGRPNGDDLSGGTFSISNMGMFDVEDFTALINPGQGAILAVSGTKKTPIVKDGRIEVASMMNVTLSVDHRIIDGVMAGNFLKALKTALENPSLLLLQ